MTERRRILVLGGTRESAALAQVMAVDSRLHVITSLAGRTRAPSPVPGETRIGGFGGVEGLRAYLDAEGIDAVVDATHPFATRISANAAAACARAGVPRVALVRPPWRPWPDDEWSEVTDASAAAACFPRCGRRVFLALGRRDLAPFARVAGAWFLIRAVEPPPVPAGMDHALVLDRGPFHAGAERALLERHGIEAIVARNSGGEGARAKLEAARSLRLPVVLIARPPAPPPPVVSSGVAAMAWLEALP